MIGSSEDNKVGSASDTVKFSNLHILFDSFNSYFVTNSIITVRWGYSAWYRFCHINERIASVFSLAFIERTGIDKHVSRPRVMLSLRPASNKMHHPITYVPFKIHQSDVVV